MFDTKCDIGKNHIVYYLNEMMEEGVYIEM